MWQCPKCGANVANISSFCPKCGYGDEHYTGRVSSCSQKQVKQQHKEKIQKDHTFRNRIIFGTIALIIVLGDIAGLYYAPDNQTFPVIALVLGIPTILCIVRLLLLWIRDDNKRDKSTSVNVTPKKQISSIASPTMDDSEEHQRFCESFDREADMNDEELKKAGLR